MPLIQGDTYEVINKNIQMLIKEGYEPKQAVAIAYDEAEKSKSKRTLISSCAKGESSVTKSDKYFLSKKHALSLSRFSRLSDIILNIKKRKL